jgi:hypothetical protein
MRWEASLTIRHIILSEPSLSSGASVVLRLSSRAGPDCARPTRAFRDRALREQRRLTGYPSLPTPGGVRGRTGWSVTGPVHFFSLSSPFRPVSYFRARAGRLSERYQRVVGLPLLLSCSVCRRDSISFYFLFLWPWAQRGCGWGAPSCAHRTSTVSSCAFCEHRGSHPQPRFLHRPLLLVPRHLPEHPLIARADDE